MVQVRVNEGVLEGEVVRSNVGETFYSFKGVPYARPPLGDLRFKSPQPPQSWEGIRNAQNFAPRCYQYDWFTGGENSGSEDCLYLNVYTPDIKPKKPLPVMLFIHGGAFVSGSGEDDYYGPDFLVRQGVVLVTINYRLEILGFLCLNTEDIPGNAGMKDQVQALRWVNKNIANFGGDPKNITIFGESAGGASVTYHLISPMSKGLFKRVIAQSGVCNHHWAHIYKPREKGLMAAKKLGFHSENDKELYEFFKNKPVEELVKVMIPLTFAEKSFDDRVEMHFAVVDEKKFDTNERFFYGNLLDALSNNVDENIEVMAGYTADDGFVMLKTGDYIKKHLELGSNFPEYFISKPVSLNLTINQQLEFGAKMRYKYFNGHVKIPDDWEQLVKFYTADMLSFGIIQLANICVKSKKNKFYLYKFSCISDRNMSPTLFKTTELVGDKPVISHMDDLFYLFNPKSLNPEVKKDSLEFQLIDKVTKIWTNFAKFGNPTPDDSLGAKWIPFSTEGQDYMDIGNVLVPGTAPDNDEYQFWVNLLQEYGQRVY